MFLPDLENRIEIPIRDVLQDELLRDLPSVQQETDTEDSTSEELIEQIELLISKYQSKHYKGVSDILERICLLSFDTPKLPSRIALKDDFIRTIMWLIGHKAPKDASQRMIACLSNLFLDPQSIILEKLRREGLIPILTANLSPLKNPLAICSLHCLINIAADSIEMRDAILDDITIDTLRQILNHNELEVSKMGHRLLLALVAFPFAEDQGLAFADFIIHQIGFRVNKWIIQAMGQLLAKIGDDFDYSTISVILSTIEGLTQDEKLRLEAVRFFATITSSTEQKLNINYSIFAPFMTCGDDSLLLPSLETLSNGLITGDLQPLALSQIVSDALKEGVLKNSSLAARTEWCFLLANYAFTNTLEASIFSIPGVIAELVDCLYVDDLILTKTLIGCFAKIFGHRMPHMSELWDCFLEADGEAAIRYVSENSAPEIVTLSLAFEREFFLQAKVPFDFKKRPATSA